MKYNKSVKSLSISRVKLLFVTGFIGLISACNISLTENKGVFKVDDTWKPEQVKVKCGRGATKEDCSGPMGVLFHKTETLIGDIFVSRCTAWLHTESVIVSNMHCAKEYSDHNEPRPLAVKETYFKFVDGAPGDTRVYKISHLIKGYSEDGVDYAYFKLANPIIDPAVKKLAIDRRPFVVGQQVKVLAVNANSDYGYDPTRDFVLDRYNCEVSDENVIWGMTVGGNSQYVGLYNCPIIGGNSGSAILNSDNKAQGLVYGAMNGDFVTTGKIKKFFSEELELPELAELVRSVHVVGYGLGGAFHCTPAFDEDRVEPFDHCSGNVLQKASREDVKSLFAKVIKRAFFKNKGLTPTSQLLEQWEVEDFDERYTSISRVTIKATCKGDQLKPAEVQFFVRLSLSADLRAEASIFDYFPTTSVDLDDLPACEQ